MEFLTLVLILVAALFILRKPEKEQAAFRMLVVSTLLMIFLFSLATRGGLLPGLNF
ncbi:MAG: dihydroneopterin aldolase [Gemmatimonadetes bacterium]|nr:dihydroneopterin aldolase [Gemmatimonadota bacterium]